MKKTDWPQELIDKYGHETIWTVTWQEYYVQHYRYHQTYADAEKLAQEHNGQVLLPVPAVCSAAVGVKVGIGALRHPRRVQRRNRGGVRDAVGGEWFRPLLRGRGRSQRDLPYL